MNETRPVRMAAVLRAAIYAFFGVLWISGCGWLILHFFFAPATEFELMPHPWERKLMLVHGAIAVPSVFLLGWVSAAHVVERWRQRRRLASGISVATVGALLIVSGYALYYSIDHVHQVTSITHEAIGVAAIVFALVHWARAVR